MGYDTYSRAVVALAFAWCAAIVAVCVWLWVFVIPAKALEIAAEQSKLEPLFFALPALVFLLMLGFVVVAWMTRARPVKHDPNEWVSPDHDGRGL